MTDVEKLGNRRFKLTWPWNELELMLDWNLIVDKCGLKNLKGICIHWQARPKSEANLGFGKKKINKFGRSWGVYVVHEDVYLSPPDLGSSNKGFQIPEFSCVSCSPVDIPEEFANGINPVAVLWFPNLTAELKDKSIIIRKIK